MMDKLNITYNNQVALDIAELLRFLQQESGFMLNHWLGEHQECYTRLLEYVTNNS